MINLFRSCCLFICLAVASLPSIAENKADTNKDILFDDTPLEEDTPHPEWFKTSLGDLREDLKEAKESGKKGIIVYFGQQHCAYCAQFFKTSLSDEDIVNYLRKHYDVIKLDIWGIDEVIDTDDKKYSERELSLHYKTNFTPSLVFYDSDGTPVFRLRGFYPPYKFRAALQYVTEQFYKQETFAEYFERANPGEYFMEGGLTERDFFMDKPFNLADTLKDKKSLAVFFEQGNCHTCDLLHSGPLSKQVVLNEIKKMNIIQLNMWKDTAVVTPKNKTTIAKEWAKSLNLFYAPSILFFDSNGNEIIRVDSVTHFNRLKGVLDYVNSKGYKTSEDYQSWRLQQRSIAN